MDVREMSDEYLADAFGETNAHTRSSTSTMMAMRAELMRRLKRNPRCPTCSKEQPVYPCNCAGCASVPDELDLKLKETLSDDSAAH